MALATTRGRAFAVAELQARRAANKDRQRADNASLVAGSDMYFGCITCNADIVVDEGYLTRPDLCAECEAMRKVGWLE